MFFFKQKTAYEMRISDWSSDVCSSDLLAYALSVVDMALILAPLTPPPLAVQVLRWFNDPDLSMRFVAAAGASLQLLVVAGGIGLWRLGELAAGLLGSAWLAGGRRGEIGRASCREGVCQ